MNRSLRPAELGGVARHVSWVIDRPPMRAFFSLHGIPHGGRPAGNP